MQTDTRFADPNMTLLARNTDPIRVSARLSWDWMLAFGVAAIAALLYSRTLQPSLGGMYNSEEYQYAAYSLSLAHSTGYPLYLLLGKIWVTLIPLGDVAFRMNLFSTLWAVAATALTFFITRQLAHNRAASVLAALVFATNEAVWRYASVAEVDTLTAFLAASVFLSLFLWRAGRVRLEVCALLYGFALVHHRSSVFYAPGILAFALFTRAQIVRSPALIVRCLLAVLLPLLIYIYVPLRAFTAPNYVYDTPSLVNYIVGLSTSSNSEFVAPPSMWLARIDVIYHSFLWEWFTGFGILLALLGFVKWSRLHLPVVDNWATRSLFGLTALLVTLITIPSRAADIDRYLIVPVMILSILSGVGAVRLTDWLVRSVPNKNFLTSARVLVWIALLLLPVRAIITNLPRVDFSQNFRTYQLWNEIFDLPIERDAVIVGTWSDLNSIRYMQRVEGRRPDLQAAAAFISSEAVTDQVEQNLANHQVVYITPGDQPPTEDYHYNALGPLLRVSTEPTWQAASNTTQLAEKLGELELVGYGLKLGLHTGAARETVEIEPGQTARLTLYWRAAATPKIDYRVRVRLVDAFGRNVWQNIEPPLRGLYPTSRWSAHEYVADLHSVYIPPGTPPGAYQIQLALVGAAEQGALEAPELLRAIRVLRANTSLADQIFLRQRAPVNFQALQLMGYSKNDAPLRAGSTLDFALAWLARDKPPQDYSLRFRVIDRDHGGRVLPAPFAPVVNNLATSEWRAGEAFKEYYSLALPKDLPPGNYSLALAVLDHAGDVISLLDGSGEEFALFPFTVSP